MQINCNAAQRLDVLLSETTGNTRSFVQKIIKDGLVSVNGNIQTKTGYKTATDDVIEFEMPEVKELDVVAQDIPLNIVYEDEYLLIVNKPRGMVVHPAPGNADKTLVNAVMAHCKGNLSSINSVKRPGIVHRIDKDTSGLLVVAKTDKAHNGLAAQLKVHSMTRKYVCIVKGHFKNDKGVIDAPIGRHPVYRKKMAVTDKNSKNAVTHFNVIERLNGYSLIECILETGRTHQIRVHLAYIGHSILGDPLYGEKNNYGIKVQMLHAKTLGFVHPITEEYLEFDSELPDDMIKIINKLR